MIIGIGIDLIEVKRIKALLKKPNLGRIFTAQEIKYCRSKANPAESFAARFAAKEAFLKAIGTGWGTAQSPKWNNIEIITKSIPYLKVTGQAKLLCRKLKVDQTHLSLTHTRDYAAAVVVISA